MSEVEKRVKTGGRKTGTRNRFTTAMADEILASFHALGGRRWLTQVARRRPELLIGLLARITPSETKHTIQAQYEAVIGVRVEAREAGPGQPLIAPSAPPALVLEHDPDGDDDWLAPRTTDAATPAAQL